MLQSECIEVSVLLREVNYHPSHVGGTRWPWSVVVVAVVDDNAVDTDDDVPLHNFLSRSFREDPVINDFSSFQSYFVFCFWVGISVSFLIF